MAVSFLRLVRVVTIALLAAGCTGGEGLPVLQAPRTLPAEALRPVWYPIADDTIGRVDDFLLTADTLTVLDAADHRLIHLQLRDGAWREIASFGRKGGGPGELQRPRALAHAHDSLIAVIENGGRIQLFGRDGRFVRAERELLPCPMFAPTLAYGAGDVRFVAGQCAGDGRARDTVFTVLLRARGDGAYEPLARSPRMALDLSWGSSFGTLRPLTVAGDALFFGTGLDACVDRLARDGSRPSRRCDLAHELFTAPAPAEVERMRAAARSRGNTKVIDAMRWPETLPVYFAVITDGAVPLLVRPVTADSLAIHPAGAPYDPAIVRFVGPLQGFVGCTDAACLWYDRQKHRIAIHRVRQ